MAIPRRYSHRTANVGFTYQVLPGRGSGTAIPAVLSMTDKTLVIFTKAPIGGQVKTRLAATVGDEQALLAHIELVESTLARLSEMADAKVVLCLSEAHPKGREWCRRFNAELCFQAQGGLGERMAASIEHQFTAPTGAADRVVLIGADCPEIDQNYVISAFAALNKQAAVFGPTEDGGYGLVGVRRSDFASVQPIFGDLEWGSDRVMKQTREILAANGCPWLELPEIWDIDDAADWQRYQLWCQLR